MNRIIHSLTKLKRGNTPYGLAPHKPILLLAVIESFEQNEILYNWITPSDQLLIRFHDLWKQLVNTGHSPNFSLPFFHLKNEPGDLWQLTTFPGKEIPVTRSHSIKSYKALHESVASAKLSDPFYIAIQDPVQRELLKQTILSTYFPNTRDSYLYETNQYSHQIQNEILYDPSENYARKVKRIVAEKSPQIEEELVLRSSIFRNAVKQIYSQQCAITGLKIGFNSTTSMVDACHILPFAETYDDTITNGIALSPTIHRAFDRGMLAISDDYTILIHPNVRDYSPSKALLGLQGQGVFLPNDEDFYPSLYRLKEHRNRFGFS